MNRLVTPLDGAMPDRKTATARVSMLSVMFSLTILRLLAARTSSGLPGIVLNVY